MNIIPLPLLQAALLGGLILAVIFIPVATILLLCILLYNFLYKTFMKKIADPDDLDRTAIWFKSMIIPVIIGIAFVYWYFVGFLAQIRIN